MEVYTQFSHLSEAKEEVYTQFSHLREARVRVNVLVIPRVGNLLPWLSLGWVSLSVVNLRVGISPRC